MPKGHLKLVKKLPNFFQASIGLLGFLDDFWDNTHLTIFLSLIFLLH